MPPTTHLPPLPQKKRRFIFLLMVVAFLVAVPVMVFYAVGYRFDFSEEEYDFKAVGGMYITSPYGESNIYVDGTLVEDIRIFRSAAYIQNLEAGTHEVYVESPGLRTWVKELPVFAHLVTEAQSFNMPVTPQVRLLTQWNDDAGVGVLYDPATSTDFAFASTTNLLTLAPSTTATSTLNRNLEYDYIASRFASSSAEAAIREQYEQYRDQQFGFASQAPPVPTTTATTTKEYRETRLYERNGEVYVHWIGDSEDIPYYYCVTKKSDHLTAQLYGAHVAQQLTAQRPTSSDRSELSRADQQFCRDTIRIDRLGQDVQWFDFMPDNEHLVLMHLTDGLYVVEVDDRAWQNTQLLYPGENIEVLLDGERIFVKDRGYYLEVFTELAQ